VLHKRVERFIDAGGSRRTGRANLIGGLIPRALGVTDPDLARALEERDQALEGRAWTLAQDAVISRAPWLHQLGERPDDGAAQKQWLRAICAVAAYRDRWNIGDDHRPLGADDAITSGEQASQRELARSALRRAVTLSRRSHAPSQTAGADVHASPNVEPGVEI
jgi:hypothetical protein